MILSINLQHIPVHELQMFVKVFFIFFFLFKNPSLIIQQTTSKDMQKL